MNRRRVLYLCPVLLVLLSLAGGTTWLMLSDEHPTSVSDWTSISDMMLRLPAPSSLPEPLSDSLCSRDISTGRVMVIDQDRSEPAVVYYGGAKIRIAPGVTMSGDVILCGGGVEFIVQGNFTGRAVVYGSEAKVILVDDGQALSVNLGRNNAQTIRCGLKKPGLSPCDPKFFDEP